MLTNLNVANLIITLAVVGLVIAALVGWVRLIARSRSQRRN